MRPVNLLPEGERRREPGKRPGSSYVLLGVLTACLLLFAAYGLTANQVTAAENEAAEASAEADRLEARIGALGAFADFATVKEARLASVQGLAQGRVDWERMMRELPRVMPEGSWLQTAAASATGDAEAAAADPAAATGATAAAPTAQLTGCVRSQNDVAALMVRLREMHRVDDVTLTESAQDDAATAPSLDSCGRYYAFDVTVSLGAIPPREAPSGAGRVPVELGGGS